jgi:hypothetical protein
MFIFILLGAFSVNRDPLDLVVVVAFGTLGYFMRRTGYPRPAMILGLVLGKPLGITLFAWLATRIGVTERPNGISWRMLHGVGGLADQVLADRIEIDRPRQIGQAKPLNPEFWELLGREPGGGKN